MLLVASLAAPDLAYDLRRGCSLVEHLVGGGRPTYLVEYGRGRFAKTVSFMVDVLTGIPSIVAALFIYALWVTTFHFHRVAFAVSLGEFGATSFLAAADRPTLPVLIARLLGRPGADNYGMALAAATVLAVLSAGVMLACERLRPREAGSGGI